MTTACPGLAVGGSQKPLGISGRRSASVLLGAGPRSHPDETTDDEAPTLPLPQQQSAQAPPDMRIERVQGAHRGVGAAGPEEIQPSAKVRVERGDTATKRLSPCSRRQLADSRVDAGFRPLRQNDFDCAPLLPGVREQIVHGLFTETKVAQRRRQAGWGLLVFANER